MAIKIDNKSFAETAKAVRRFNPAMKRNFVTDEEFERTMRELAFSFPNTAENLAWCGTAGYIIHYHKIVGEYNWMAYASIDSEIYNFCIERKGI